METRWGHENKFIDTRAHGLKRTLSSSVFWSVCDQTLVHHEITTGIQKKGGPKQQRRGRGRTFEENFQKKVTPETETGGELSRKVFKKKVDLSSRDGRGELFEEKFSCQVYGDFREKRKM